MTTSNAVNITVNSTPPSGGGGTGLKGEHFDYEDLTNLKVARIDPTVNFDWGSGSPDPSIQIPEDFSVRWSGQVKPRYTETYTFYTMSDDGVRLWVNNQLLINDWTLHAPTENSATITLTANQSYDIRMEFMEAAGGAVARLSWSSARQAKEIIPQSQLYPGATSGVNTPPSVSITAPGVVSVFSPGDSIQIRANASDSDGISRVNFYAGGTMLGTDNTAPYEVLWPNVQAGTYSVQAEAIDNANISGFSTPILVTVNGINTARVDPKNRTGQPGDDLLSGNYNWSVPLVSLPGRAGLDLGLTVSYNSLVWTSDGSSIKFNADNGFPTPGFRLGFPVVQPRFYNFETGKNAYLLITPSGQRVELRQIGTSNVYEAADSSYLQLIDNGNLLVRSTDGTQLTFVAGNGEYVCTKIKDRNGNYISVDYNGAGRISGVTDTLGRVLIVNYDVNNNPLSITQQRNGIAEPYIWATFAYGAPQTINTNFRSDNRVLGPANNTQIPVLRAVGLTDGSRYEFDYTTYGQVSRITHAAQDDVPPFTNPDGSPRFIPISYVSYNLPDATGVAQTDCPRFTERRDWARYWNSIDSGAPTAAAEEAVTTFDIDFNFNRGWSQLTMPDGTTRYRETFDSTGGWGRGLVKLAETFDATAVKKSVETQWMQDDQTLLYQENPRVKDIYIRDAEGHTKRTHITHTTYGLPHTIEEYAADATTVLRKTQVDYNLEAAYTDRRIIGLVRSRQMWDGGDVLHSKMTYEYDTSGTEQLAAPPVAATQHDAGYSQVFTPRGNLTRAKRWAVKTDAANYAAEINQEWGYNITGAMTFTQDHLEHKTTIAYADGFTDGVNTRNTFAYPTTVTDADGYASTMQYHYDTGLVGRTQDPKGAVQVMTYDTADRRLQITTQVGGVDGWHRRWAYPSDLAHVEQYTTRQESGGVKPEDYSVEFFDGRVHAVGAYYDKTKPDGTPEEVRRSAEGEHHLPENVERAAMQVSERIERAILIERGLHTSHQSDDKGNGERLLGQSFGEIRPCAGGADGGEGRGREGGAM